MGSLCGLITAFSPATVRGKDLLLLSDDAYYVIWVIDPDTGGTLRGLSPPGVVMGNAVPRPRSGLGFHAGEIYYTLSTHREIWVLDSQTGALRRKMPKPAMGISGLGARDGALFAVSGVGRSGSIFEIDPFTGQTLATISLPGAREAIDASASRGSVFVRVGEFEIAEVDTKAGRTIKPHSVSVPFMGLAFSDDRSELFALTEDGAIFRIQPDRGEVLGRFDAVDGAGNDIFRCGGLAAGLVEGEGGQGAGVLPETALRLEDTTVIAGEAGGVRVLLSSTGETQGFQVAVVHDPGVLRLDQITTAGTETVSNGADFVSAQIFPNGGTLGVVFDIVSPYLDNVLPPGPNRTVARYVYACVESDLSSPSETSVRFLDGILGSPPKDNIVVFEGLAASPDLIPGRLTCVPRPVVAGGPEFYCGGPLGPGRFPTDLEARSGDRVELCFYYRFDEPEGRIQGLSMAIAYDCRLTCIEGSFNVPPESILAQIGADFVDFQCDNDPDDGDGCEMILAVLADALPPFGDTQLPATIGTPLLLACVDVEVGGGVEVGECLEIRFRDGVNGTEKIPTKNLVSVDDTSLPAKTFPCKVCVTATGPSFFCGAGTLDANDRPNVPVADPGEAVEVCFWYNSPGEDVLALTQALRFDCRLKCLEGTFFPAPETPAMQNADFISFRCDNDPADGDPCELALDIVAFSTETGNGMRLPATNRPRRLGCAMFQVSPDAHPGYCLSLEYFDRVTMGEKVYSNTVTLPSGRVAPNTFDCRVCVPLAEPPKFLCGGRRLGPDGLPEPIEDVPRGSRVELCLWYSSPVDELTDRDEIQGLSMSICFDCNLKCIEGSFRIPPDSILAQVMAEFVSFQCDNDPNDGDGCEMILGILVDFMQPVEGRTLPPSEIPLKLACVDMEVNQSAKPGFCLDVKFCDGANGRGKIPIKNIVSMKSASVSPRFCDCAICVSHLGPYFLCGGHVLGPDNLPVIPGGRPGEAVDLCFWYCSPEDGSTGHAQFDQLQGLSMALTFDCRLRCLEDSFFVPEDTITAALGAEYVQFHCDNDPNDGDGCEMVLAILIDAVPPFDGRTLPPTEVPLKLACVKLVLPPVGNCGDCFFVRFTDGVNGRRKIPIFNQVSTENQSFLARTVDCKVCITTVLEPFFHRGDCNFSNMGAMSVDIADAAEVMSFLFGVGTWRPQPPCLDACDANDDGRVDLADAFAILQYLFRFGREPPAPGPINAGPDPTADKLDCDLDPCP